MNVFYKAAQQLRKEIDSVQKMRMFRKEVSRLASMANKRIKRLEKNDLTNTPAYQRYIKDGGEKFGIKGKDFNRAQRELARIRRFVEAQSSTVRGANTLLKDMASNTGIMYKDMNDLKQKADKFFDLASKIEQYLDNMRAAASDVGYQKIWEAINVYVKEEEINLLEGEEKLDKMVEVIGKYVAESQKKIPGPIGGRFFKLR